MDTQTIKTAGVIVFNQDKTKVLMVEHLSNAEHLSSTFGIPAGRLDNEHSLKENASREFTEETGLIAEPDDLVELPFEYEADIIRKDGIVKHFHLKTFLCRAYSGSLIANDEDKPIWVNIADF